MANLWDYMRPDVRDRLTPHREMLDTIAKKHGVDPQSVYMLISAESSGNAGAIGDKGVARGLYQVQTPYLRDYGMSTDVRHDPRASSEAVIPVWGRYLKEAGGDWGIATTRYMRGTSSSAYKALKAGKSPQEAFGSDGIALARYEQAKSIQSRYNGQGGVAAASGPQMATPTTPTASAASAAGTGMRTDMSAGIGAAQPTAFRTAPVASAPVVRDQGMGTYRPAPLPDVSSVYRMFGIDKLV